MSLKISYIEPRLKQGQYHTEQRAKDSIFLHHTAGSSAAAAVSWWNQTVDRVGTALLVERDGKALQDFEIACWASHLGIDHHPKNTRDENSVGIEIVSYGFVIPEDDVYYAYPLWPLKTGRVKIAEDQVVELAEEWRGFKFWHKYTDEQVKTVIALCKYLVDRFEIKVQKDLSHFYEYNADVVAKDLPGIWAHSTVRKDKWDIFPQPNLIKGIQEAFKGKK
jgi:N-acetyl-anhydromuramyl-L-alanine amidase AmpD